MTIPLYLAVAQWALLFALGLLVFVMYRQLGRIYQATTKASADTELGPAVDTMAASFEYTLLSDGTAQHFTPGGGRPSLLAFVDPTCPACEQLVSALNAAADGAELDDFRDYCSPRTRQPTCRFLTRSGQRGWRSGGLPPARHRMTTKRPLRRCW